MILSDTSVKRILIFIFALVPYLSCFAQIDSVQLLKPTGRHPVGTVTYEWIDESRDVLIRDDISERRTLIAQLWYPATVENGYPNAPYNAISPDYRNTFTNSYLRPSFSKGMVNCPLIFIVPGRGTERFLYTTIAEELASRGFVVVSIDMPRIGYVIYQDGFILRPSQVFKPPKGLMSGPYEKVDAFFETPTAIGCQDLFFALKKIEVLNESDPSRRFINKIDVSNIGVFAHSLGGRIGGEFTASCNNVKALASMEGIPPRDVRYEGKIAVPSLMLCSSGTYKYAADNYNSFITNRKGTVYMAELRGFGHNSLTDNPFIHPERFTTEINPEKALKISRQMLVNFFNVYLNGETGFYAKNKNLEATKITFYPY